jgi:5-methylcytosine-specific restriction endonuclease McrA
MPNYLKHYNQLCSTRKQLTRTKKDGVYYERHHIVPKSLGGNNDKDNLVLLTAREHYIAHLLLYYHYKTIGGEAFRKMSYALVSMASNAPKMSRYNLSASQYEIIREAAINSSLGKKINDTTNYKKPKTDSHREAIRQARLKSDPRTLETRNKMSKIRLERGLGFTGNNITVTCPHCNKVGQSNAMKRWHFDKCKEVMYA